MAPVLKPWLDVLALPIHCHDHCWCQGDEGEHNWICWSLCQLLLIAGFLLLHYHYPYERPEEDNKPHKSRKFSYNVLHLGGRETADLPMGWVLSAYQVFCSPQQRVNYYDSLIFLLRFIFYVWPGTSQTWWLFRSSLILAHNQFLLQSFIPALQGHCRQCASWRNIFVLFVSLGRDLFLSALLLWDTTGRQGAYRWEGMESFALPLFSSCSLFVEINLWK